MPEKCAFSTKNLQVMHSNANPQNETLLQSLKSQIAFVVFTNLNIIIQGKTFYKME